MNSNELISREKLSLAWGLFDFSGKPKLVLGADPSLVLMRCPVVGEGDGRQEEEESLVGIFLL